MDRGFSIAVGGISSYSSIFPQTFVKLLKVHLPKGLRIFVESFLHVRSGFKFTEFNLRAGAVPR